MKYPRSEMVLALLLSLGCLVLGRNSYSASTVAAAQSYPSQPVRIIVPQSAGWLERHLRAADPASSGAGAQATGHCRQPLRRRRHRSVPTRLPRPRPTATRCWWWRARSPCCRRPTPKLPYDTERDLAAGGVDSEVSVPVPGQLGGAGQDAAGVHRAREAKSGQIQLCDHRAGEPQPSRHRAAQPAQRHEACSTCPTAAAQPAIQALVKGEVQLLVHVGARIALPHLQTGTVRAIGDRRAHARPAVP